MDESSEEEIEELDVDEKEDNLDWYRPIDPTIYSFLKDYYQLGICHLLLL